MTNVRTSPEDGRDECPVEGTTDSLNQDNQKILVQRGTLNFSLLRQLQGVIDLNAQTDGRF